MANNDHIPAHVLPYLEEHKHRLILTDEVRDYNCVVCCSCKTPVRSGWSYACIPCNYAVHKQCAEPEAENISRPSIWLPKSKIFDEIEVKMLGLISTSNNNGSYQQCLRCGERCTGTIKCLCSNGFNCHESCSLLSVEIQHPFHNHNLILGFPNLPIFKNPSFNPSECCNFCKSKLRKSSSSRVYQVYQCNICPDFYIHIECAQQMPMLKHSAHQHPLCFLRIKQEVAYRYDGVECNWCGLGWSDDVMADFGVYRCISCDFSIHENCLKYHKFIVNENEHQHQMQHIPPDQRGDEYEWNVNDYCETCAKDIAPNESIYKCLKCPNEFLFHLDCAITSSQEFLEPNVSPQQDQEICKRDTLFPANMLFVEQMSELMGKIESLTLELEEGIRLLTALKLIRKDLGSISCNEA